MTTALISMQWAVGASLVILAAITLSAWLRHRGRSRLYLALTVGLLAAVAILGQVSTVTEVARSLIGSVAIAAFMASAVSLALYRGSVIPGTRLLTWVLAGVGAAMAAAAIIVNLSLGALASATATVSSLNESSASLWIDIPMVLTWCVIVSLSIVHLWLASRGVPRVQRARLRAMCAGFTGLILALVADSVTAGIPRNVDVQLLIQAIVLGSTPLLAISFLPPAWLRRVWREPEEVRFREALNDLLLYSPDIRTLCQRALEWSSRLLGGHGALIALNGSVIAAQGLDDDSARRLHAELEGTAAAGRRSLVTVAGPTAVAPLLSGAGRGYIAVVGGPFTPLLGDEEVTRLDQYRVSLTLALDRVHLSEGVRRNADLLDLAYDPIFTWDVETRAVQYWNRAAEELYGFTRDEARGRDPQDLFDTVFPIPIDSILDTLRRRGHWEGELVQRTKSGQSVRTSARWALQRDTSGAPIAVLEIDRDITAEMEAAEQLRLARDAAEQASKAKSEYLSRMSHELRTPLAAMLGFSDLLEMREPREDQMQAIQAVQRAGSHLLSLVNDVLDIARIESGRENLSLAPIEAHRLLEECAGLVHQAAAERRMTVVIDAPGDGPVYLRADRQRLGQVLLNLVTNAVKYGNTGGHVQLGVAAVEGEIELTVADDGPGVDEADQARLFQPFERLGAERTHVQGTGLGLSLCLQLTTAMGGTIGVRSRKGEGATFWVRLQAAAQTDEVAVVAVAAPAILRDADPERTVLYVEDNLATVGLVESIFALRPTVRLITAMQGSLAVELATKHHPDLVILDLHLPDLNGDEVMRRLRDNPRTAHVPVVIYSADATETQVERLLKEGAAAYLTKPARVTEFLAMIDRTLAPRKPVSTR